MLVRAQLGELDDPSETEIFRSESGGMIDSLRDIWYNIRIRLHGQAVKTPPFHGGNRGSNPLGVI